VASINIREVERPEGGTGECFRSLLLVGWTDING
jgi:hypothetical protein